MNVIDSLRPQLEQAQKDCKFRLEELEQEIANLQKEQEELKVQLLHLNGLLYPSKKLEQSFIFQAKLQESAQLERDSEKTSDNGETEGRTNLKRPPLLPEFRSSSPIKAIEVVLKANFQNILSAEQVAEEIFGRDLDEDSSQNAKRHTDAELSRGARQGRWYKVPGRRGLYTANPDLAQEGFEEGFEELVEETKEEAYG